MDISACKLMMLMKQHFDVFKRLPIQITFDKIAHKKFMENKDTTILKRLHGSNDDDDCTYSYNECFEKILRDGLNKGIARPCIPDTHYFDYEDETYCILLSLESFTTYENCIAFKVIHIRDIFG